MDTYKTLFFSGILPLEIVEKIVSYLPLSTVAEVMNSENGSLALMARRRYYSNIELRFYHPPNNGSSYMNDKFLIMRNSEFEALVNSDMFSQLYIKKLLIDVDTHVDNFTFLHEKVFTKVSSFVTNVILNFDLGQEDYSEFYWDWLPSSPLVQKCIREISISYAYIDPDVPSLPSNLRKLTFLYDFRNRCGDGASAPRIIFPSSLQEFVSEYPWGSMSVYAGLPSTLQRLELVEIKGFSTEAFNELNLPNLKSLLLSYITLENFNELRLHSLKDLRLKNVSGMTEIDEHFIFPSLLENLELYDCIITNFERRNLPLRLQKLSISGCPLKKFRVDTFPDSFKELILGGTVVRMGPLSSEIRSIKFPPSLIYLQVTHTRLSLLDFVNILPGSLESLYFLDNPIGRLNETDEDIKTTRTCIIEFPKNLRKLNLSRCYPLFILYSPRNLVFPPSLTDLILESMNLASVEELDLPLSLNSLNLSSNKLVSVDGLSLPPVLTSLNLSFNKLVSVKGLDIPPTLTTFNLHGNNLELFSRRLPDSIQLLDLRINKLKNLVNFRLPVNCTELKISYNPLQRLQISNAYDPNLKLRNICLSKVSVTTLRDISPLPQCLTSFSISDTNIGSLSGIQFPRGLTSLHACNSLITSLEDVELPLHLEELRLWKNQISSLANVHFPDSLLKLEFDDNMFTSIDAIQLPPKLKELSFERNVISAISELQLPESLEMLNLADQKCDTLHNCVSTYGDSSVSSSVSWKGLSRLSGLTKLPPKLGYLNLEYNNLSKLAIQHLEFPDGPIRLIISDDGSGDFYQWETEIKLKYPRMMVGW
ncbi:hypothetical protein BABINDRAFT_163295 [Babjeviella inositovora NRRL Y-12698]|uniref:Uncharacterized protein n=1 Tax=Babjeviella inositovora NRRL Y-12698 TaxID=984486 RepID=A0A1E3QJR6_9ASCO|nr:uncharacterized protein BABINDRAFT_163295 [Babjeviella inositovora NRRL Y-12698]ODQ77931.1 hypothetical protein BABINDRAFT_163295 [Babjeviella inositovora NRRL Y-12698]